MANDNGPPPCKLEVCVAALDDARTAAQCGAARIELNSALELGGLTPSIGLVECVVQGLKTTGCDVIAMVRPRPGGFAYEPNDLAVMRRDIDKLISAGVDGVALGVLQPRGHINEEANRALIQPVLEAGRQAVFHRAFDLTPEPIAALQTLISLGFTRVLTSGGAATAQQGAKVIRSLIEYADGQIEVLPGSGIRPDNVNELVRATGCTQVHASLRSITPDPTGALNPSVRFSEAPPDQGAYHTTDRAKVTEMIHALRSL